MKLRVLGLSVALALASLCPSTAADSRNSSSGFSSKSTTQSSKSDTVKPAPARDRDESRGNASQPRQSNSGFISQPPPSRTSGGFVATPSAPNATSGTRQSATGFTTGGTTPVPRTVATVNPVDRIAQKSASQNAFRKFQQERNVFKAPEINTPPNRTAAQNNPAWRAYGSHWNNADAYYAARSRAFAVNPGFEHYYTAPPVFIRRPAYGAYAAAFLGGVLLDRAADAAYANWAYSHSSEQDYQAWHQDMEEEAANNEELRAKLAILDQKVAELQAQNASKTEALPPDVDPSMVVAPSTVLMATTPEESSHAVAYSITGVVVIVLLFLGACVFISQRKRRFA